MIMLLMKPALLAGLVHLGLICGQLQHDRFEWLVLASWLTVSVSRVFKVCLQAHQSLKLCFVSDSWNV